MQDIDRETSVNPIGPDRRPCPVCGHPTSDCSTGVETDLESRPIFKETAALTQERSVYVHTDIIEEREIAPHTRVNFVIAKAGTYVTPAKAKELGII